jgi:hypothetical protein
MKLGERAARVSNGRLLQGLALGHALVGTVVYGEELREIAREGIVGAVPYRGARATAFWFLAASPLLWSEGRLLHGAEQRGDARALRGASGVGLVSALIAAACVPVSGFWVWGAISLRGLRKARELRAQASEG